MIALHEKYPALARLRKASEDVQKMAVSVHFARLVREAEDVSFTRLNGHWEQMPGCPEGVVGRTVRVEDNIVYAMQIKNPAATSFPLHYHARTDERMTVIQGTALLVIYNGDGAASSEHILHKGDSTLVKAGCLHGGFAQYGEDVVLLCEFPQGLRHCPKGECDEYEP